MRFWQARRIKIAAKCGKVHLGVTLALAIILKYILLNLECHNLS